VEQLLIKRKKEVKLEPKTSFEEYYRGVLRAGGFSKLVVDF